MGIIMISSFLPTVLQERMGTEVETISIGIQFETNSSILTSDQPIDKECFNMAVRIVACDNIQLLIKPPVHNMDLRLRESYIIFTYYHLHVSKPCVLTTSALFDVTKHPKWHVKTDVTNFVKFLHN